MKIIDLSSEKEKINSMYRVICIICGAMIVSMLVFGVIATLLLGVEVVGQAMVMFEIPPISVFPFFYSKPITWLMASSLAFWFSLLQLRKEKIRKISRLRRHFFMLLVFFMASMAAYEILYNFSFWSGSIAAEKVMGVFTSPDEIPNPYPNPEIPWNVTFATKIFVMITILATYTFIFLNKINSEEEKSQKIEPTISSSPIK